MKTPDYNLVIEAFPLKYNSIVTGDALNFPVFWETRNLIVNHIDGRGYPRDITQPTALMVKCAQFYNETVVMAIIDDYSLENPIVGESNMAHIRVFEIGRKFIKALPPEYAMYLQMQALERIEETFMENGFDGIVIEDVNAHAVLCKILGYDLVKIGNGRMMWMKSL